MEDTLRVVHVMMNKNHGTRLNPCFNGRYSQRIMKAIEKLLEKSLNPCFNGRYSQSLHYPRLAKFLRVLILVLMEDTLRGIRS